MNKEYQSHREKIAAMFVAVLTEKRLNWHQGWNGATANPTNASTGRKYKGINRFFLEMVAEECGYLDNRWATFLQIKESGWHLKKGAKASDVEYWFPYDTQLKKAISWEEYHRVTGSSAENDRWILCVKHYKVFNGSLIEGLSPLPQPEKTQEIVTSKTVEKLSQSMGVTIHNDGRGRAFYNFHTDTIHLPPIEQFFTSYHYHATALHELAHATGHESRLNRTFTGNKKTESYALEELVAELSACFMGIHQDTPQSPKDIENHMAYLQSWISHISKKPEALFQAIAYAEKVAGFMEYHLGVLTQQEYVQISENSLEVAATSVVSPVENRSPQTPPETPQRLFPARSPKSNPPKNRKRSSSRQEDLLPD